MQLRLKLKADNPASTMVSARRELFVTASRASAGSVTCNAHVHTSSHTLSLLWLQVQYRSNATTAFHGVCKAQGICDELHGIRRQCHLQ